MLEELRKRAEERRKKMEATRAGFKSTKLEGCQLAFFGYVSDPFRESNKRIFFCCELIPPSNDGQGFC